MELFSILMEYCLTHIALSANLALQKAGLKTHDFSRYKYFVGEGVKVLITRALNGNNPDDDSVNELVRSFREIYDQKWAENSKPYSGINEMLFKLESMNLKTGILSNKPDDFTKKCIEYFFDNYNFDPVMGQLDPFPHKPDPQSALYIARTWGLNPNQIVFVGDTAIDMQTASKAGMFAVGGSWGFRPVEELLENGAQKIVYEPSEILDIFLT